MDGLTNISANETQRRDAITIELICRNSIVLSISISTIIGHCINIRAIGFVSTDDMSSATKMLYRALSVADILTSSALLSGLMIGIVAKVTGHHSEIVCKLTGLLMTCAPGTSALFILLLNTDRFIYITRPLHYHALVTTRRTALALAIAVPYISVTVTVFALIHDPTLSVIRYHESITVCKMAFSEPTFLPYSLVMFSLNIWLVALVLPAMYSKIITISRHHRTRINAHRQVLTRMFKSKGDSKISPVTAEVNVGAVPKATQKRDASLSLSFQQNVRTLKTPLLITGCYLFSWIPFSIMEIYMSATATCIEDILNGIIYRCVATAAACNSSANLFIYYLSRRDLRQAVRSNVCKRAS